jgi:hypothetical protein
LQKPAHYLEFGTRFHQLLEHHYAGSEPPASTLGVAEENECQAMFEQYKATYPEEPFQIEATELAFELEIPGTSHLYIGRIDMLVRDKTTKQLSVFETKTESRGAKRNLPEAWAARTQASLYTWAASTSRNEKIDHIVLNIATKGSPKGQVGPMFRRDTLERTDKQIEQALSDLRYVADQIEQLSSSIEPFPRFTNSCVSETGWKCDFYSLCHYGESEEQLGSFVQVEPYAYLKL